MMAAWWMEGTLLRQASQAFDSGVARLLAHSSLHIPEYCSLCFREHGHSGLEFTGSTAQERSIPGQLKGATFRGV